MTEEEAQKLREELPKWTEEFVQREWYREFLEHYPLSEYLSLLEVYPPIAMMTHNYRVKYCLDENLSDTYSFMVELRNDFLNLYYKDFHNINNYLIEKYENTYFDDWSHLTLCTTWFLRNKDMVVELDNKHNNTIQH